MQHCFYTRNEDDKYGQANGRQAGSKREIGRQAGRHQDEIGRQAGSKRDKQAGSKRDR